MENTKEKETYLESILKNYQSEFEKDISVNEFNVREKQMMLPGIKHKYVAFLIKHKRKKFELEAAKKIAIEEIIKKSIPDIGVSRTSLEKKHENHPTIKKINDMISEQNIIIDYLEKIENITKSMTFDIGNLVKIIQLETT
jgi:hypothetical protein